VTSFPTARKIQPQPQEAPAPVEQPKPKRVTVATDRKPPAIGALREFFEVKWQTDPSWFERNADHPDVSGRTRKAFGRSEREIYFNGAPDRIQPKPIADSGWFFDANIGSEGIKRRIQTLSQLP
jgi:hypothetical protein